MDYMESALTFVAAHKWWFIAIIPFVLAAAVLKSRG